MNWKDARDKIEREAKAIEFSPPDEVVRLFKWQIVPSGQGNVGQAFTTMVFVEGDARATAYYNVLCLIRLIDEPSFTVDHMKILFKEYVPLSTNFLSTCGLEKIHELVKDFLSAFDSIQSKSEFKELLDALGYYVSALHGWVHHYFPWYIGDLFPQRTAKDWEEMGRFLK